MRSRKTIGVLGLLALAGVGLYRLRRQLVRRMFGLSPVRYGVNVRRGLRVATPDGVELATDLYQPNGGRLHPTVMLRTPYGRNGREGLNGMLTAFMAQRFAERGYNVVVQDVRGRYDSSGEFEPFIFEAQDGRATLAWLEQQPWFNGVLGMWGASYLSYTAWAAAVGAPLYLKAIVPSIGGTRLPVMGMRDNAFAGDMLLRWVQNLESMKSVRNRLDWWPASAFEARRRERKLKQAVDLLPLNQSDRVVAGRTVKFFQEWLEHRSVDEPYWKRVNLDSQAQHVTAAVHLVGGWYDILLRETLDDYRGLRQVGRWPYLTIGPWAHMDQAGLTAALRESMIWFDAYLKGDRRGLRLNPVRIYLMGEERWVEMESWPPPARPAVYYLQPDGGLEPEMFSEEEAAPDTYQYDPHNPTPALGGPVYNLHAGRVDNRSLERRPDVLTYTTAPLEQPLQLIGPLRLELFVRSSLEYTDFFGRVCDVSPKGLSMNVCDGLLRISPGVGEPQPDGSLRIIIDLWPTAYTFPGGHRLRLQVSSGAHPRWSRNLGSGEPLATGTTLLPADQQVFHDRQRPSALTLPLTAL
jgi:uncharacterized protein